MKLSFACVFAAAAATFMGQIPAVFAEEDIIEETVADACDSDDIDCLAAFIAAHGDGDDIPEDDGTRRFLADVAIPASRELTFFYYKDYTYKVYKACSNVCKEKKLAIIRAEGCSAGYKSWGWYAWMAVKYRVKNTFENYECVSIGDSYPQYHDLEKYDAIFVDGADDMFWKTRDWLDAGGKKILEDLAMKSKRVFLNLVPNKDYGYKKSLATPFGGDIKYGSSYTKSTYVKVLEEKLSSYVGYYLSGSKFGHAEFDSLPDLGKAWIKNKYDSKPVLAEFNGRILTGSITPSIFHGSRTQGLKLWEKILEHLCEPVNHGGGAAGDPHIKRWGQESFDFHGECDMVLVHSDHVNGNKPLDVHIRTTINNFWSAIESAVVRVGDVIVEMDVDKFYVNGNELEHSEIPFTTEEFVIQELITDIPDRESFELLLNDHSSVYVHKYKNFLSIGFRGDAKDFAQSYGLMGNFYTGAAKGRDGRTIENWEEYGMEWQVRDDEPKLFRTLREPQLPNARCKMPEVQQSRRHLRSNADPAFLEQAQSACAHAGDSSDFEDCVSDVLATGDLGYAGAW